MFNWLNRWNISKIPSTPDHPCSFGYKTQWLAVAAKEPTDVWKALRKIDERFTQSNNSPCNWQYGLDTALKNPSSTNLFLTPSINGYVVAVEYDHSNWNIKQIERVLSGLSQQLGGRACLFVSHRVVSLAGWAVAEQGKLLRAYQIAGDTIFDFGEPLPEERELGIRYLEESQPTTG